MTARGRLEELGFPAGKRARLHRLLYDHGPGGGTALFLPYDQGLEHGPRDFWGNPEAADPRYILKLAVDGGFSAVVFQIGLAERYFWDYAGEIPLVLKVNGKGEIPPSDEPLSPCNASVEDAVRLGADAVGYTLYSGSSRQEEDFIQLAGVRADCQRFGMPLIIWSYPRGKHVDAKGGRDSLYQVAYAARVAHELGGDMVKINFPKPGKEGIHQSYADREFTEAEAASHAIEAAQSSMVLISGGEREDDDALLAKARASMEAGATGLIFGRNIWQRSWDDSLKIVNELSHLLQEFAA